jgi:hypothetical protein
VVVVGQDHGCFHFCWREAGWSSCSSSSRHDFAHCLLHTKLLPLAVR